MHNILPRLERQYIMAWGGGWVIHFESMCFPITVNVQDEDKWFVIDSEEQKGHSGHFQAERYKDIKETTQFPLD